MCALLSAVSAPPQTCDSADAALSLSAPSAEAAETNPLTFRFALMFGGFVPRSHDVRFLFDPPSPSLARVNSLHVFGMFFVIIRGLRSSQFVCVLFHRAGSTDVMVIPERSRALIAVFGGGVAKVAENGANATSAASQAGEAKQVSGSGNDHAPEVIEHGGGHFMPMQADLKRQYVEFIARQQQRL